MQGMTLSKKDLGTKYDKAFQSECVMIPERETLFLKDKLVQVIIQAIIA